MEIVLEAAQTHKIGAYVAKPEGTPKGCVVVLHEAFGVTPHIQRVCRDYAGEGFVAVAPALFSWSLGKPEGIVLPQTGAGLDEARKLIAMVSKEQVVETVRVCVKWAKGEGLKSAVVGYCWGGSCAYFAAAELPEMVACSSYYGGKLWEVVEWGQPKCPRMAHFATLDRYIPLERTLAAFNQYDPQCEVFVYEADHGFNRDDGKTFDPEAARLARERTLEIFNKAMI